MRYINLHFPYLLTSREQHSSSAAQVYQPRVLKRFHIAERIYFR